MLITLTSTAPSASDLSHLLRKHPAKAQSFDLAVGTAHVVYPEATEDRCTVALLLEVDPIALVRDRRFRSAGAASITHYVNDRPYASSSMLAVALGQVFRTAMGGRSDTFPELAASALPLTVTVAALPARGGADLVRDLFAPLGWRVEATPVPLDPAYPAWGDSLYVDLVLTGEVRLADALRHLYVLLPVLDDGKHYWVSEDEVGKLLRAGDGWLAEHPARDLITRRYLAHQRDLVGDADERLDAGSDATADPAPAPDPDLLAPRSPSLARLRAETVHAVLTEVGARTVADVGCGSGALLAHLVADPAFTRLLGTDVASSDLEGAARRLGLRDASDRVRERIRLLQSSATYEDPRIAGLDAIVLMEVIEHVDPDRHAALEASVFGSASPAAVVVTTPNAEHNALYPGLAPGALRHPDHRFEWTRAEFADWAARVADRFGYLVEIRPVGDADPVHGSPTQLALFRKAAR
ncbi:bifunctional 3-demethylubiquinone-9 3-methyltransferase/ 2-octaprenyl-6-hydroxy phenol methylase [Clavibacter michiganensis]|uniref:Small RNA 2'-O-methyltransferase n=1 Tax=Clavibacter michiganensis TaxID=28447 RepID=A0A251Y0N0_9MICO|nr:3' terminal RNA ribose 2'-O-methyltransferase Hen1 [Clavibacter michiganensis]OUE17867.1 bifunctional 3-demethylubiquinone-9 3-methyltransferase/ 2-octaprenyl-6-hydroxy phenol methylase [Clavibacter michiganensis]